LISPVPPLIVLQEMSGLQASLFLRQQAAVLLIGSLATCVSLYLIAGLIHAGVNTWFENSRSSAADTFKGIPGVPDPGGSAAFGLIFPVFLAALCWWSVISEWKQFRADRSCQQTKPKE
jgi:hypothetical protein